MAALFSRKKPSISQKGGAVGTRARSAAGQGRGARSGAMWTPSLPTRYNLAVFLACVATR
ncbi:protein of unknown function [Burkholderia multivorans]